MSHPASSSGGRNWLQRCFYSETDGTPEGRRATRYYIFWSMAWAFSHVGATWLLRSRGPHPGWIEALVIAFPLGLSLVMLGSFLQVLQRADELMRKIQVDALALGFGVMVLVAFGNSLLESAGSSTLDLDLLATLGIAGYGLGVLAGLFRHK